MAPAKNTLVKNPLVKNPLFARYFNRFGARREARGNRELRQELLSGLSGRVIEVGAGNGLNFPHYPRAVWEVVAVEPEPYLRDAEAEAAAAAAPRAVPRVPLPAVRGLLPGRPADHRHGPQGGDSQRAPQRRPFDSTVISVSRKRASGRLVPCGLPSGYGPARRGPEWAGNAAVP